MSAVLSARDSLDQTPKPLVFLKLSPDLSQQEKKDIANVLRDKKVRYGHRLIIFYLVLFLFVQIWLDSYLGEIAKIYYLCF